MAGQFIFGAARKLACLVRTTPAPCQLRELLNCSLIAGPLALSCTMRGLATVASHPIQPPDNLVHASHTDIQALMPYSWQIASYRHRSLESRGVEVLFKRCTEPLVASFEADFDCTQPRQPSDSYLQLIYPFSTSASLRDQYRRFTGDRVRWGLLLEDMDTLAGDIAGLHAGLKGGKVPATAFVDRFNCNDQVSLTHDLRLDGQVTWVGRSSLEVLIALSSRAPTTTTPTPTDAVPVVANGSSKGADTAGWSPVGYARFCMAMRDKTVTRSVPVPPLQPVTAQDKALFLQGQEHQALRKQKRATHWRNMPPTDAEVRLIHQLAVSRLPGTSTAGTAPPSKAPTSPGSSQPALDPTLDSALPGVHMHLTELRNAVLMHSQDRNHFNRIFGGHLMRLAFEHAFATAAMHAGEWCDPMSMEDVVFLQPVPIQSVMSLRAKVVYTEGPHLRVLVEAMLLQPGGADKHQEVMTNDFAFSFLCRGGPVRPVIPETVVEALEYVLGQRQHAEELQLNQ